jgi:hypothetical protein
MPGSKFDIALPNKATMLDRSTMQLQMKTIGKIAKSVFPGVSDTQFPVSLNKGTSFILTLTGSVQISSAGDGGHPCQRK